ncbi:MoaD/ThiS family protein [Gramella sp. AN32]|uniref:Molybdopterin synthase sulfur carrier subunit n=1 Tax=Christiangramia antarctica TaxID=2058158 RepID=A0ABW5X6U6_9FLAO|nr:MoaD/ThiS family protein [Gramella sp. AN32]MCM4156214.1 molybdopterin synthase sulfur carrier subunit [Gramella sp. AN32]
MNILLFGITRDIVGRHQLDGEEFKDLSTVGDLRNHLQQKYPDLQKLSSLNIAVNEEMREDSFIISGRDEIALIPPVSGG